jgi:hypothetical protein
MGKLAVMQPYFFPYIGYWQLIHAVDRFVIFDDVRYINRGWVNRNRLLINGEPSYFTASLQQSSQNKRICDTVLQPGDHWRSKLIKTVENTYRKAACFDTVFPVVKKVIRHETDNLADYLANQLQTLATFMNVDTEFVLSSRCYKNDELAGQDRILDICNRESADTYINPQGGLTLYEPDVFQRAGIDLRFLVMRPLPYKQRSPGFVPYLSIIDALMEIGPAEIRHHLDAYELLKGEQATAS